MKLKLYQACSLDSQQQSSPTPRCYQDQITIISRYTQNYASFGINNICDQKINQDAKVAYKLNHKPKAFNYLIQYYRGITPNLIGNISAWGIYFALYAEFKSKVKTNNTTMNYFASSVLAGLSTSIITNPLWVLKTRILGSSRNESNAYRSVTDGIRQMLAKKE